MDTTIKPHTRNNQGKIQGSGNICPKRKNNGGLMVKTSLLFLVSQSSSPFEGERERDHISNLGHRGGSSFKKQTLYT